MKRFMIVTHVLIALALGACSRNYTLPDTLKDTETTLNVVAELTKGPGNITVTPAGQVIVSVHQFYNHDMRVARVNDNGQLSPFATAANVNSVLGVQADANDVVWLLDKAMRKGATRRCTLGQRPS